MLGGVCCPREGWDLLISGQGPGVAKSPPGHRAFYQASSVLAQGHLSHCFSESQPWELLETQVLWGQGVV